MTFWGTGNPGPWTGDTRPGDNLYTNSVVAFDVDTGALKGYHQYHWNDSWDWDEVSAPLLIDVQRDYMGSGRREGITTDLDAALAEHGDMNGDH